MASTAKQQEPVEVTVEIDGTELAAGTLWIHGHAQSATFQYATAYLRHPAGYDLDPELPCSTGPFQTLPGRQMFNAFSDGTPDRWGQNLMRRGERDRASAAGTTARSLATGDFLLGTRDDVRQGAIRFRRPGTEDYWSIATHAVPDLVSLGKLLDATDRYVEGDPDAQDMKDLVDAGGSLGGARPKVAVLLGDESLAIAKFPRKGSGEWDVIGWEKLEPDLAERAGIDVAPNRMEKVNGRNVLVVERFDRFGKGRLGFVSALTMLESADGNRGSYLEIANMIQQTSDEATRDLRPLFRRIVFSILTSNTDDHLRNHGFLRYRSDWRLAPAYDPNPNPESTGGLTTAIDTNDATASIELALSVAEVEEATRGWRGVA